MTPALVLACACGSREFSYQSASDGGSAGGALGDGGSTSAAGSGAVGSKGGTGTGGDGGAGGSAQGGTSGALNFPCAEHTTGLKLSLLLDAKNSATVMTDGAGVAWQEQVTGSWFSAKGASIYQPNPGAIALSANGALVSDMTANHFFPLAISSFDLVVVARPRNPGRPDNRTLVDISGSEHRFLHLELDDAVRWEADLPSGANPLSQLTLDSNLSPVDSTTVLLVRKRGGESSFTVQVAGSVDSSFDTRNALAVNGWEAQTPKQLVIGSQSDNDSFFEGQLYLVVALLGDSPKAQVDTFFDCLVGKW